MLRMLSLFFFLALATTIPFAGSLAQSSAGRGAVGGAIIGGAIGGRRGAAVGAIAGAAAGSRHMRNHYYWRHGRCWVRTHRGSHPVASRYCR
jgi:hypothetical protein